MAIATFDLRPERFHITRSGGDLSSCPYRETHRVAQRGSIAAFIRALARRPEEILRLRRLLALEPRLTVGESLRQIERAILSGGHLLVRCPLPRAEESGGGDTATAAAEDEADETGGGGGAGSGSGGAAGRKRTQTVKTWIEIELVDENGEPAACERYEIRLPDGRMAEGRLDGNGRARHSNIDPGTCVVCFPDFDATDWRRY